MIYAAQAILDALLERGALDIVEPPYSWCGYSFGDQAFHSVTKVWVQRCWEQWVADMHPSLVEYRYGPLGRRYYPTWRPNVWDCENHHADFGAYCARQHAIMALHSGSDRFGTGVLNMCYVASQHRRGAHNIGVVLCRGDADRLQLEAFEAGDGVFVNLQPSEWRSAWHIDGR